MQLFLDPDRARASPIAPMASRGSGRSRRTARSCCPRAGGRSIDIAALEVAGSTARGQLRSDPGGFTGQLATCRRAARAARSISSPVGGDQRIEAHLAANNLSVAGPTAAQRPIRPGRRHDHPGRRTDHARRRRDRARADDQRHFAGSPDRQRPAGQRVRRSQGGAGRYARHRIPVGYRRAASAPDRISITGRGELARRPLTLDSPAVLTRVDGGWEIRADPGAVRRRSRDACRAGPATSPNFVPRSRRCRCNCSIIVWPKAGLGGIASGRVDYRWAGAAVRQRQPARSRASAAPAWCWRPSRSTSASTPCLPEAARRCARWRSATARPSAGPRRDSRHWAAGRSSPS